MRRLGAVVRKELRQVHRDPFSLIMLIGVQVALDLSIPQVSLAAHASGLVAGLLLGALGDPEVGQLDRRRRPGGPDRHQERLRHLRGVAVYHRPSCQERSRRCAELQGWQVAGAVASDEDPDPTF